MSEAVSAPAVDVAALRAALGAASKGPWEADLRFSTVRDADGDFSAEVPFDADAELIVLLRNNAEALLDAQAKVERVESLCTEWEALDAACWADAQEIRAALADQPEQVSP